MWDLDEMSNYVNLLFAADRKYVYQNLIAWVGENVLKVNKIGRYTAGSHKALSKLAKQNFASSFNSNLFQFVILARYLKPYRDRFHMYSTVIDEMSYVLCALSIYAKRRPYGQRVF